MLEARFLRGSAGWGDAGFGVGVGVGGAECCLWGCFVVSVSAWSRCDEVKLRLNIAFDIGPR